MSGPRRSFPRRPRGLDRRSFLKRAGGGAALLVASPLLPGCGSSSDPGGPSPGQSGFFHGVASGDPLADRVILWTRYTPAADRPVEVAYEIARDPALQQIVQRGLAVTDAGRDYTVKVDPVGLQPGTTYYYRFRVGEQASPVGRTRTATLGATPRLRVGVVSCSSLAHGLFNAYRTLAARADLDVVLHLGDYLYEYGTGQYGTAREYDPPHEIITLADYRRRHAQYKRDADLQEAHRQHPFITVWDDHESTDNSWRDGAANHTEGAEGLWPQRKAWAIQAYHEWMPIRLGSHGDPGRIFRHFQYGDLANFTMLDTRLFSRDEQASATDSAGMNDAGRQLLGPEQLAFLEQSLQTPARWQLLGQQVMFGQLRVGMPELSATSGIPLEQLQSLFAQTPLLSTGGVVINPDQWDGYRAERQRVFALLERLSVRNPVVLTGDIHTSWVMDLSDDPNNPVAYNPVTGEGSRGVEFVCTSITSPGLEALNPVASGIRAGNPHIKYVDLARKGYLLLDITPEQLTGEYWYVDSISEPSRTEALGAVYRSLDGSRRVSAGTATTAGGEAPPLAP